MYEYSGALQQVALSTHRKGLLDAIHSARIPAEIILSPAVIIYVSETRIA
jgi:hypothetical protein